MILIFRDFRKIGKLLSIGYEFNSKQSTNFAGRPRGARAAKFLFSKNHRDLQKNIFLKIHKYLPFTSKNNRQKENLGNNFFKYFNLGPQNGQNLVSLNF